MQKIRQVTNDALQTQTIVLADGSTFDMTMYYIPQQYGWFLTNITYGNFVLNSVRITTSPNILYQYKNQIPFGIACVTKGNLEPTQQQDFADGTSALYLLTAAEVDEYSEYLSGQV